MNSSTSGRRSDELFSNVRPLNSSLATVCVSQTSELPGILPPLPFNVAGDTGSSPKVFSNVLLNLGGNRRDESLGDSVHLESDDNWFFDAGIFETDWLRWGGFSSDPLPVPEVEQMPTGVPLTERHMSTCSNISASGNVPSLTNSRPASGITSKDICSPASTPSEYGAYPANSKEVRLPSVSPIKDSSAVDGLLPWGWRATREEPKRRITLPPLRQVLEDCSSNRLDRSAIAPSSLFTSSDTNRMAARIGTVSDNIRNDLISVLKVPYARHPYYDDCDIEHKFPSKELIDGFIVLYFEHFHSILPMIHKPTFRVEKCPSILLVAMASIGASYSDIEGAKGFADGLSELCKRALTWMAEFDNEYLRSEYYLTAFCLQHAYALGSGHQALYDAADSTRSFLVANARRCGLFSDTTSPCTRPPSVPSSPRGNTIDIEESPYRRGSLATLCSGEQQLNARWLAWVEQEKRKRVVWAIFSYDSSFSTLSNRRGDISLNDIKSRLPCEEKMWEAPTAEAWAAMLPTPTAHNASLAYRGMPFFPTLHDVIARKLDPKEIPSWGKELCAWALGRMLWDFKEMEQTAQGCGVNGVSGLGLPVLTEGLKQTKETALAALTALGEAAWKNCGGECDKVHSNLTSLIAHYSHLHFGVPTISLILSLARNPPPSPCMSKCPSETVEDARITRLRSIFSEDPVHARTIAWHAGQIIGISRHRPVHTPAETMRVFLAGVVLWGVAKWFVECRSMAAANTWTCGLNNGVDIRLDKIPIPSPSNHESSCGMPAVVSQWLKTGKGRATIRKDGDDTETGETQLCSERGAKEVLQVVVGILGKMRIWGLGAKFRRVLEVMGK
ncbi:hypothetical protein L211DRAFT_783418 [Terfezia boudieri ATCC MYA-4762]|uniref:Xylanolytic transcriptional activator regulatory domain-containing protein n=1 Tax=Terfezia boudieri ATCC MYA-4762 TaxID=1051890 RepID=A0A3N4LX28_9PEZI|nr:hypothetical protein L211DRAFT_783418 [Terfezia boudieri ATCC MYA-4762]